MARDIGPQPEGRGTADGSEAPRARVTLGAALRAARQQKGLTLEDVASRTRVRRSYLEAMEDMRIEALPSRPFAIGYVKAYAAVLDLNPDRTAAAFKQAFPEKPEAFKDPIGVAHEDPKRSPLVFGAVAAVAGAVLLWNVAQRATIGDEPPPPPVPEAAEAWGPAGPAVVEVGPPLPPPVDQTIPPPYETPGLAAAAAEIEAAAAARAAPPPTNPSADAATPVAAAAPTPSPAAPKPEPVRPAFNPKGTVHGEAPRRSRVTIQAREAASVVVRRKNGQILFARQLAAGEAYRAPNEPGLTVDISEPGAFDLFVNGELKGRLDKQQNPLDKVAAD